MSKNNKEIRTVARSRCILCGTEGKLLYADLVDGLFDAPGVWNLRICSQGVCQLIWLDPAPVEEDLPIAYETYFTHATTSEGQDLTKVVRSLLYRCYKAAKALPSALVGLRKSQQDIRYMFLGQIQPGKILDVGCGDGAFLDLMRKAGWSVDGLDFDKQAIENARIKYGLQLRQSDLQSAHFEENTFDAVTLNHVIEHVPDPVSLLNEARRTLKPGGRLVVTTPNSRSFGHEKFQKYWVGLDPPRHLNVFTLPALGECARRAGFESVRVMSTAANADIVLGGSYAIRHFNQHRAGNLRPQINIVRSVKSAWFQYLEFLSLRRNAERGEEAVLICVKKAH